MKTPDSPASTVRHPKPRADNDAYNEKFSNRFSSIRLHATKIYPIPKMPTKKPSLIKEITRKMETMIFNIPTTR